MWPQEDAEEKLGKTKFIMFTGRGGTTHPTGLHEKEAKMVRRQKIRVRERFRLGPLLWFQLERQGKAGLRVLDWLV